MPRGKKKVVVLAPKEFEVLESPFAVTLKIGNETYQSSGASLHEALIALTPPTKMFLKGVLSVTNGTSTRERLLYPAEMRRLVQSSPSIKRIYAKQLSAIMK